MTKFKQHFGKFGKIIKMQNKCFIKLSFFIVFFTSIKSSCSDRIVLLNFTVLNLLKSIYLKEYSIWHIKIDPNEMEVGI